MRTLNVLEKEVREELNAEAESEAKEKIRTLLQGIRNQQANIKAHQVHLDDLRTSLKKIEIKTEF